MLFSFYWILVEKSVVFLFLFLLLQKKLVALPKKCICINTYKNAFKICQDFSCFQYFVMFIRQFFRGEPVNKSLVLKLVIKCLFSFFKVPGPLCNLTVQERMDALLRQIMEEYSRLKALQTQLMAECKQVNFYILKYMSI